MTERAPRWTSLRACVLTVLAFITDTLVAGLYLPLRSVLLTGAIFGLATLATLKRLVLDRLARVSLQVGKVAAAPNAGVRVPVDGHDELSSMTDAINRMLDAVHDLTQKLGMALRQSDRLLLNILPIEIAERLKHKPGIIAERFDETSVLFCDLAGFTAMSARVEPDDLAGLLNGIFTHFYGLADRHGVEKIKTIGDAYMCVAGLPVPRVLGLVARRCHPHCRGAASRTRGVSMSYCSSAIQASLGVVAVFCVLGAGVANGVPSKTAKYPAAAAKPAKSAPVTTAVAWLVAASGAAVKGSVRFVQEGKELKVTAHVEGLTPGAQHGFHVHDFGDCSKPDASSAGGHFNPDGHDHGLTDKPQRHAGDLGNLTADANGVADLEVTLTLASLTAKNAVLGRGVIIHAKTDDGGQPAGNAGARIGCGVIGAAPAVPTLAPTSAPTPALAPAPAPVPPAAAK